MAVEQVSDLNTEAFYVAPECLSASQVRGLRRTHISHFIVVGLLLAVAAGCSSNKAQTFSQTYVQSVVNLNSSLVVHVSDESRLASATSALQQADSLIRQTVERRDDAVKTFAETNANFDATPEQLSAVFTANQAANSSDVETLIELIATFQSSLTSEELMELYPERAEFAAQTLMLLNGN